MKQLILRNKGIFLLIFAFLVIVVLFSPPSEWWDSAVYTGMGKFIYSGGSIGLWEPARPIFWPLLLGFFWTAGGDTLFLGSLLAVLVSAASIYILYMLINELVDKKTALLFSFLFALNTTFIFYSNKVLADIPAMFFALFSAWLLINKKKFFFSGLLIGIATLTKFTSLLLIPLFLAGIYLRKKLVIRNASRFVFGSLLVLLPYLLVNFLAYKNPFYSFIKGQELINTVVGNYYCPTAKLFFLENILRDVPLLVISVLGIYVILKKREWRGMTIMMAFSIPLIYHSFFVNCKDMRYAFIFLPYLYIIAAKGYQAASSNKKSLIKYGIMGLLILQIAYSVGQVYSQFNYGGGAASYGNDFYNYARNLVQKGEIWSSTPFIVVAADVKIDELVYYPVFDNKKIEELSKKLNDDIGYIFLDTCDIPCVNYDLDCPQRRAQFLEELQRRFGTVFQQSYEECELRVYSS